MSRFGTGPASVVLRCTCAQAQASAVGGSTAAGVTPINSTLGNGLALLTKYSPSASTSSEIHGTSRCEVSGLSGV